MTLISLDKHKRELQKEELKKKTNYLMNLKRMKNSDSNLENSTASSLDKYMINALKEVRESDISFETDYTNMTGSGLFHPKTKPSIKPKKKIDNLEKTIRQLEQEVLNDLNKSNAPKPKKSIKPESNPETKTSIKNEELTWNRICEQLDKPRLNENRPKSFFGQLRESLQVKNQRRIFNMKRNFQYEK